MITLQPILQHAVSTPRLPPELMDLIVDILSDDVPSLTACALSSRQLLCRSRYHQFHTIHFDFLPNRLFNRCEIFSRKCQNVAPLVKLVGINIICPQVKELKMKYCSVTNLGTFLGGFHKLNKLALHHVDIVEETSSSSEVSLDLEELVITHICSRSSKNTIKYLLPLLSIPPRIRRLTYPIYPPVENIPQYDVIPYTHLDELLLVGAFLPNRPILHIQNVTRLHLSMIPLRLWHPVDACKYYDELTDWLIHLLQKAQGGCLKEVKLEYGLISISWSPYQWKQLDAILLKMDSGLIGIPGSPGKWKQLDAVLSKMELSKVELVFNTTQEEWGGEGVETSKWKLDRLALKYAAFFEQVKRRGLLTVSGQYLSYNHCVPRFRRGEIILRFTWSSQNSMADDDSAPEITTTATSADPHFLLFALIFRARSRCTSESTYTGNADPKFASNLGKSPHGGHRMSFFRRSNQRESEYTTKITTRLLIQNYAFEPSGEPRNVYVNYPLGVLEVDVSGKPIVRYERNKVRTTNLYEQFRRKPIFPYPRPSSVFDAASGAISVLPLVFILTVTDIKDAVEDYRRATLDEEVKTLAATKLGSWRNRRLGAISPLEFPDLNYAALMYQKAMIRPEDQNLSVHDQDQNSWWTDRHAKGRWSLKPRKSIKATSSIASEDNIERSSFYLDSEPPHQNVYLYHGVLRHKDTVTGEKRQESVMINEMLLRGCAIRNTTWIIGQVIFTGADTKIIVNGSSTPSKRSEIEKETNFNVIVNDAQTGTSTEFFEIDSEATDSSIFNAIITFVSCLIAFQNIVPISLYIFTEIAKTIQAYFISQDVDMYYQPYNTPCVPKTWNISDDLGQIEYTCSVHGIAYGEGVTEAQRGAAIREGNADSLDPRDLTEKLTAIKQQMLSVMERTFKNRYLQPEKLALPFPTNGHKPEPQELQCHLDYKAESQDGAALVASARGVGFTLVKKSKDTFDIQVMGQPEKYTLLNVLEFNSTRKRMSTIFRCPDGRLILYCKGGDNEQMSKDMEMFANNGLRTLCITYRWLTPGMTPLWLPVATLVKCAPQDFSPSLNMSNPVTGKLPQKETELLQPHRLIMQVQPVPKKSAL
ncbi:uncharacterized protein BT62DRAFT_924370 [Guyanagaster necrorhizus]|uniref:Uncharacterized protein n=1 Tax=Guyanagaster necrorhizus TaxID=856835 RepID=A0A9P7VG28_9AGAR|nr:uncharacterized protein BT62DRAFT_924370 [Guyanagaster necrorhizus MCA 3950]KAG7439922.1 hypothetical protein BT62DRAFT_924370 [Guyanagaster necrorhizus MCA 3950]